MKPVSFIFLFILMLSGFGTSAQNPIPSYNVPINQVANFQEGSRGIHFQPELRGEKVLVIRIGGSTSSSATVWVYSLDGQDVYGPFTVYGGQTIYVPIDDREWGVLVQSDDHVTADVWIETGSRQAILDNSETNVSSFTAVSQRIRNHLNTKQPPSHSEAIQI